MNIFCMAVQLRPSPQYKNSAKAEFLYCGVNKQTALLVWRKGEHFYHLDQAFWQTLFLLIINPQLGRELLGFGIEEKRYYFLLLQMKDKSFKELSIERRAEEGYAIRIHDRVFKSTIEYSKNTIYIYFDKYLS